MLRDWPFVLQALFYKQNRGVLKLEIFKRVQSLKEDFDIAMLAYRAAHDDAKDITAAVQERIESDKEQTSERLSVLRDTLEDETRAATVRRMAEQEIKRLEAQTFEPTEEERAGFDAAIEEAAGAVRDMAHICSQFRAAFDEAKGELTQLRTATLGSYDGERLNSWLESLKRDFNRMYRG